MSIDIEKLAKFKLKNILRVCEDIHHELEELFAVGPIDTVSIFLHLSKDQNTGFSVANVGAPYNPIKHQNIYAKRQILEFLDKEKVISQTTIDESKGEFTVSVYTEKFYELFDRLKSAYRSKEISEEKPTQAEVLKPVEEERKEILVQSKIPKLIVCSDKEQNRWKLKYGENGKEYIPEAGHKTIFEKLWESRRIIKESKIDKKHKGKLLTHEEIRKELEYKDEYALRSAIGQIKRNLKKYEFPIILKEKLSTEDFIRQKEKLRKQNAPLIDIENIPGEGYMLIIENIIVEEKIIK